MKIKTHFSMIFRLLRPFLFILIIPLFKVIIELLTNGRIRGYFIWEFFSIALIILMGVLSWKNYNIYLEDDRILIEQGVFLKKKSIINLLKISSVEEVITPFDKIFNAKTYQINTEAGLKGRADFRFKLSKGNAKLLSKKLYKAIEEKTYRFSIFKMAAMAATTSSIFTGIIIGVPLIRRSGSLLEMGLEEMLLERISDTANNLESYFPPIVNMISIVAFLLYAVAFLYTLTKYINFLVRIDDKGVLVECGFLTKRRIAFKKRSINNIKIEQTPLMRFFKLFSLSASVGGFGNTKKEKAIIIPCGKYEKIEELSEEMFRFEKTCQNEIIPKKSQKTKNRFLFKPLLFGGTIISLSFVFTAVLNYFDKLMLFFMCISLFFVLYYANLCLYNYRNSMLFIGKKDIIARGIYKLASREIRCRKEKIGEIKLIRYPADIKYGTCKVKITVRSESADSLRLLHLDYQKAKEVIFKEFSISE